MAIAYVIMIMTKRKRLTIIIIFKSYNNRPKLKVLRHSLNSTF